MKRKVLLVLLCLALIYTSMLLITSPKHSSNLDSEENLTPAESTSIRDSGSLDLIFPHNKSGNTIHSGVVVALPWKQDQNFIKAQADNNVFMLMAAYRTVLLDPLPGEEYNVHLAAQMLRGTVLKPGEVFSQNERIGPYTQARGFQIGPTYIGNNLTTTVGGGVCKLASTLYNVVVISDLEIIERHPHTMPVPYVPYGQDATVSYGCKDLKFRNNSSSPVMIWAEGIDNILYIAFYGQHKPPKVEWHHTILQVTKTPRIYRSNYTLPAGTEKVILEGMDGALIKSWLTISKADGTTVIKDLGRSYYMPMPYIIEKGGKHSINRTDKNTSTSFR